MYTRNMKTFQATEARNRFFEILNLVMYKGEEVVIEKDGKDAVRMVREKPKPSAAEVNRILKDLRKTFAKSAKRKYWSVIDTPAWKKKESKYLENLSKGIIK